MLNTIVAEAFKEAADELENSDDFDSAVHDMIKRLFAEHRRIIFSGNGYSEEWVKEAERRGLPNLKAGIDSVEAIRTEKAIKLFEEFGVYTRTELESRAEIEYEAYSKTVNIEAKTMLSMMKKTFLPSVLSYCKELAETAAKTKAILPDGDTVNYAYYEGKGINPGELIDLAETMPFFAERRLIVVENSGFFKNAAPELADYIKTMPDTACFIFVENEVDKRNRLYKAVKDKGRVVELGRQDEKTLLYWIGAQVKREGKLIKTSTAQYLVEKTGTDMENLEKELEKLFAYTLDEKEITPAAIDEICTAQISNKIFEMVEAVAAKHQKKAMDLYYDLLALKEPPMRILYLLSRQFKQLMEVKALCIKGMDKSQIAKTVGIHPFVAGKYMSRCRSFGLEELRSIMEDAADTEQLVKTGRLSDVMSVELFIVKYSSV